MISPIRMKQGWYLHIVGNIFVIPALEKLKQEDHEFKANLGYITRS
jgi:hypothetical protein